MHLTSSYKLRQSVALALPGRTVPAATVLTASAQRSVVIKQQGLSFERLIHLTERTLVLLCCRRPYRPPASSPERPSHAPCSRLLLSPVLPTSAHYRPTAPRQVVVAGVAAAAQLTAPGMGYLWVPPPMANSHATAQPMGSAYAASRYEALKQQAAPSSPIPSLLTLSLPYL